MKSTAGCETTQVGAPTWAGYPLTFEAYEHAVLRYQAGLKDNEKSLAVARLWTALQGAAKEAVKDTRPNDFAADGVEALLRHLREGPLGKMPIPDAYQKIRNYDQVIRRPGEVIGEFVIREDNLFRDMRSALQRLRADRLRREEGTKG